MHSVRFKGCLCRLIKRRYHNDRMALRLVVADTGEPFATCTVNLPYNYLADDEVILKNHAENEGMLEALITGGVVVETCRIVRFGGCDFPVVRVVV